MGKIKPFSFWPPDFNTFIPPKIFINIMLKKNDYLKKIFEFEKILHKLHKKIKKNI